MMDKINATKILEEALSRSLGLPRYIEIMAGNPNKSEFIFQSETSTSGAIWILYSGYASLTSLYMI